jgi:predicted nucleic acid-binding protein
VSRYLVDNSVLRRLPRSSAVQAAVSEILDAEDELCGCSLTLDEFAFSARSAFEHEEGSRRLRTSILHLLASSATDQIVIDIRTALWRAGKGHAAGVVDVAIAALAVSTNAAILHYDSDFDHIADVYPDLQAQWVVPRGTID